jgi:hypothetical protein
MAYIGREPQVGNFQVCDAISVVNGQAAYTMQVGGANVSPETANHMIVSLNGIIQAPGSSYTVSGSTITFASNLVTGDVINFIHILGSVLDLGVPSDNTVTAAKVANDLISGKTALASEPADTDEFLVSDAGVLKRIDYSLIKGGGITVADQYRVTANITANAVISSNIERVDTTGQGFIGSAMSESSGIFTFPSTGVYLVSMGGRGDTPNTADNVSMSMEVTTDNSSYNTVVATGESGGEGGTAKNFQVYGQSLVDVTNVSNVKVRFSVGSLASGHFFSGSTDSNQTYFTFIRLGDT